MKEGKDASAGYCLHGEIIVKKVSSRGKRKPPAWRESRRFKSRSRRLFATFWYSLYQNWPALQTTQKESFQRHPTSNEKIRCQRQRIHYHLRGFLNNFSRQHFCDILYQCVKAQNRGKAGIMVRK